MSNTISDLKKTAEPLTLADALNVLAYKISDEIITTDNEIVGLKNRKNDTPLCMGVSEYRRKIRSLENKRTAILNLMHDTIEYFKASAQCSDEMDDDILNDFAGIFSDN